MELAQKTCTTYRAGSPPITRKESLELLIEVPGWSLENGQLTRQFEIHNSGQCIDFFNEIMKIAMQEGQIPDITLRESRFMKVSFYTYPAGGLTINDFIMAAKINTLNSAR
jgi:4a-hydroxytetrahydrobiopterin dehydratase